MKRASKWTAWWLAALLLLVASVAQAANKVERIGVLVVAPDRGFLGNEEVRNAFAEFAKERRAELLFVTDARSQAVFEHKLAALDGKGAKQTLILPLFVAEADVRWQLMQGWVAAQLAQGKSLTLAPVYGDSYLAVEDLSVRLNATPTHARKLLLVGYGAADAAAASAMDATLLRLGQHASNLPASAISAVTYPARTAKDKETLLAQVDHTLKAAKDALVVPVALAPRNDSMMVFARWFAHDLPASAQLLDSPLAAPAALADWMRLAFNRASLTLVPPAPEEVGVVVLAHGADWFWNQAIRKAVTPLEQHHPVAFAFTMADQTVMELAIRKLETKPVRGVVVVRAFGMASSFRGAIERQLGLDVFAPSSTAAAMHDMHAMHGMAMHTDAHGQASLAAAPRIRSTLPQVTVGGVEADPLFARALLDNARAVSRDPAKETILLVAHGAGADADNDHWLHLLNQLADQMRQLGGSDFRAIATGTWREDWPDKRKQAVEAMRQRVLAAQQEGGRALVIPARINGQGAADHYLKGLDFGWGQGFVQTPWFVDWIEQEVGLGVAQLTGKSRLGGTGLSQNK